jgi:hypothetical protein
VYQKMKGEY